MFSRYRMVSKKEIDKFYLRFDAGALNALSNGLNVFVTVDDDVVGASENISPENSCCCCCCCC